MRKFFVAFLAVAVSISAVFVQPTQVVAQEISAEWLEKGTYADETREGALDSTRTYWYTVLDDNTAMITMYSGDEEDSPYVVIPSQLDGYTVSRIEYMAFYAEEDIISIHIPATITTIDDGAFGGNTSLQSITVDAANPAYKAENGALFTKDGKELLLYSVANSNTTYAIPEGVTYVGESAFEEAVHLKEIVMPTTLTGIGRMAFRGCTSLENLVIPDSVTEVGYGAFGYCGAASISIGKNATEIEGTTFAMAPNITSISVAEGNTALKVVDGVLYSMDGTKIIRYPSGIAADSFVVPEGVTTIGDGAFSGSRNLKNFEFASSVTTIGSYAFGECDGFTSWYIPDGVTTVGEFAFGYSDNIYSVKLPDNLEVVDWGLFVGCKNLRYVSIPKSVTAIYYMVFSGCDLLTDVYYGGSEAEWSELSKTVNGNMNVHYNSQYPMALEQFVERMYTIALNRESERAGLANWVWALTNGVHDGAGIAKEFILGAEFGLRGLSNSDYVDVLYRTFFNREADAAGKDFWIMNLEAGNSREYVLAQFVNLDEFKILCGQYGIERGVLFENGVSANPGIAQFVSRLYKLVMGREADKDGLYFWTLSLTVRSVSAESMAKDFFNSQEYLMRGTDNTTYVTDLYKVFMNREPDGEGLATWVTSIEQGNSRENVLSQFAGSEEFKIIAAGYGLQ